MRFQLSTKNASREGNTSREVLFRRKVFRIHGVEAEGVFPVFDGHEVKLDEYYMSDAYWQVNGNNDAKAYNGQMAAASEALAKLIDTKPEMAKQYSRKQLDAIRRGCAQILGMTWHHKEDWLVMQLVDSRLHSENPHTGGSYTWNKKHFK